LENRRAEQVLARREGWQQWEPGGGGERGGRVNMVQIVCTHVCKCNNETCCNYSRKWGRGIKENDEGRIQLRSI
jgi:hypothetical protein